MEYGERMKGGPRLRRTHVHYILFRQKNKAIQERCKMAGFFDKIKDVFSKAKEGAEQAEEIKNTAEDIKDTAEDVKDQVTEVKEKMNEAKEKREKAKQEKNQDGPFLAGIKKRAAALNKHIVLPEGEDARVVKAASEAVRQKIARITLLGKRGEIEKANPGVDLSGVEIVDPAASEKRAEYAQLLYSLRKAKGMTEEEADKLSYDNTYFGVLMVKAGDADGLVSGACHSTANTLRPGLQIVKAASGVPLVSSFFLMIAPAGGNAYCEDGAFLFSDCGLNENPNSEQLADIAVISAQTAEKIAGLAPRVAMLSFSTKGSAKHADIDKVTAALAMAREKAPELNIDGELQLDAAIVPSVAKSKAPGSKVAGHANVLIFPDLDAGNIGYKLAERLGGFQAVGPVCQGFAKPINDLSRGCKWEDIVATVAITALQTQM